MFRKKFLKKKTWSCADSTKVIEPSAQTIAEQDENGTPVNRVVYLPVDYTSKEVEKSLPDAKDYTLENLLSAGVPLEQVAVSSLLNPTDFATNQRYAENMINSINIPSITE